PRNDGGGGDRRPGADGTAYLLGLVWAACLAAAGGIMVLFWSAVRSAPTAVQEASLAATAVLHLVAVYVGARGGGAVGGAAPGAGPTRRTAPASRSRSGGRPRS